MPFTIKFIEGKALVVDITNDTLAQRSGIAKGDIVESIDGLTIKQLIDKKRPVISASNYGSMLHSLEYLLVRSPKDSSELVVRRNNQVRQLTSFNFLSKGRFPGKLGTFAYERDSALSRIKDSIGYINLGNLQRKDSLQLRALVECVKGLIIDNRQYPKTQTAGDLIGNLILPPNQVFVKFSYPFPDYPGLFPFSLPTGMGTAGTTDYFSHKIAILINEETQSSTEFQAMVFRKAPRAALIGSYTAGADGNVALINLPGVFIPIFPD
ncbi:S41 family peptidase [Paraflavitalea speifideaquila]|uniref:S41 family peptidase n=1 Tax=Paraflavitalea speifideaquila TaxID=3076558 RepID=UPI0028ED98F7|nr:S41 family peptidase [Paraflavitalea speifideiaquila]